MRSYGPSGLQRKTSDSYTNPTHAASPPNEKLPNLLINIPGVKETGKVSVQETARSADDVASTLRETNGGSEIGASQRYFIQRPNLGQVYRTLLQRIGHLFYAVGETESGLYALKLHTVSQGRLWMYSGHLGVCNLRRNSYTRAVLFLGTLDTATH